MSNNMIVSTNAIGVQVQAMLTSIKGSNGWGRNNALLTWKGIANTCTGSTNQALAASVTAQFDVALKEKTNWGKNELELMFLYVITQVMIADY